MSSCKHESTHYLDEPWPTGETIEVCDLCGMSRAHWGQGESGWVMIADIPQARKEIEELVKMALISVSTKNRVSNFTHQIETIQEQMDKETLELLHRAGIEGSKAGIQAFLNLRRKLENEDEDEGKVC